MSAFQTWLYLYEYSVNPYFHGPVFQIKSLTAYIAAVLYGIPVMMYRAYHISQGIYETFGEETAGMRTIVREGE